MVFYLNKRLCCHAIEICVILKNNFFCNPCLIFILIMVHKYVENVVFRLSVKNFLI